MRVGIHCPVNHKELSDDDCLTCRTGQPQADHHCDFAYEHLKGMMTGSNRTKSHISATMLGGICPRKTWLSQRTDWYLNPERGYSAFRGTLGHLLTEQFPEPGAIIEQRFELILPDGTITGQIDKLHIAKKTLTDFKTKAEDKTPPKKPDSDHIKQLNVYRYLVKYGWPQQLVTKDALGNSIPTITVGKAANIDIDKMELIYWTFGWVKTLPVPVLPDDEVLAYITEGVKIQNQTYIPLIPKGLNPESSVFCRDWCPVRSHCLADLEDF